MSITRSKQYGARTYSRESATSPTAKPLAVILPRHRTMKNFSFIILIFFFSCNSNQETKKQSSEIDTTEISSSKSILVGDNKADTSKTEILETFIDSLNIGEKGKCKIELIKHQVNEDNFIIIKFYRKGQKTWYIQNTYFYETNSLMEFQPVISDYNNDSFNDITFISGSAARGANEVRRLFIYDNINQELVSIVNSQDFPNMQYNKELDCIDAFLVHGGSSTVFARIKKDSLIEFASVHNDNNRTVYEIDKFGKERLLRKDTIIDIENVYVRYSNYKPLKEWKE